MAFLVVMVSRLMAAEFDPFKDGGATEVPKQTGGSAGGDFDPDKWLAARAKADQREAVAAADQKAAHAANGLDELTALTLKGNAAAAVRLAGMYARGDGVPQDHANKLKWLRKAAELGNAVVQAGIGSMFFRGDGVAKDSAEGVKWYRMAADQGDVFSQWQLGRIFYRGDGVPKDVAEAVKWYRMAADQGDASAQATLGYIFYYGEGVAKDGAEGAKWYQLAANQGDTFSQYTLGWIFSVGDGMPKDIGEAVKWYRKAADQGYDHAQFALGVIFFKGDGIPKDSAEAVKWYRMAAIRGHSGAQGNLGAMYSNGEGVSKDSVEGLAWTNIAAASGEAIYVENRSMGERRLGPQATLAAQQRSKEILKEIEATQKAMSVSLPKTQVPPSDPVADKPKFSGSGTIVSAGGHVLTAAHVIAGAKSVKVLTARGTTTAKVLRIDEANDLAVLKLAEGAYAALPVAASRTVRLGQTVATIGFPNIEIQGFSPKVTRGEISSLNGFGDDPRAWQISVPVQTGNSGGPLLDESGNLVGVVVAKLGLAAAKATGDLPQNVSYAVKSAYALALLEPYLDGGGAERGSSSAKMRFEDMVAKAQQSAVLIMVY